MYAMLNRYPRFRIALVILIAVLVAITSTGFVVSAASTGYISGQVSNENNEVLPGATVRIISQDTGNIVATTTTNQDGEYLVEVETGDYQVEAEYNGETGSATVSVSDGDTAPANIIIVGVSPEPATGSITGDVVNENDEALPGATVRLIDSDTSNVVATTTADDYGSYVFGGVETGDYRVEAEYNTETGFTTTTVYENTTATADIVISGVSPEPATGSITGNVVNENDELLPGATVKLVDVESGSIVATTTADQGGSYTFSDVETGQYTVKAEYNNEVAITLVTVSEDMTSTADIVISGVGSDSSPKAAISVEAPQSITAGETADLRVVVSNVGSAVASSGGLQITLSGPVSIENVSGDGTGSPNRFFISPLSPGDNRTVIYTLRAESNVTGEATITTTGIVGDSMTTSQVTISVKETPETLTGYYRQDDGEVTFLEVLDAISAYNRDNGRLNGYGQVEFLDVLDLIAAYNE